MAQAAYERTATKRAYFGPQTCKACKAYNAAVGTGKIWTKGSYYLAKRSFLIYYLPLKREEIADLLPEQAMAKSMVCSESGSTMGRAVDAKGSARTRVCALMRRLLLW